MLWMDGGVTPVAILTVASVWPRSTDGAARAAAPPAMSLRKRRRNMRVSYSCRWSWRRGGGKVMHRLCHRKGSLATKRRRRSLQFRIIKPGGVPPVPIDGRPERGRTIPLVDAGLGTENLDLHINVLLPKGPSGREHRHSRADNV